MLPGCLARAAQASGRDVAAAATYLGVVKAAAVPQAPGPGSGVGAAPVSSTAQRAYHSTAAAASTNSSGAATNTASSSSSLFHGYAHNTGGGGGSSGRRWRAGAAGAAAAALLALGPAAAPALAWGKSEPQAMTSDGVETSGAKLLSLDMRRRIFFKYEKRIREMSSLEKVYEYFATNADSAGAKVMDARDVVRAVVSTYPAIESTAERAGFLDGERGNRVSSGVSTEPKNSSFRALDDDGDGFISFQEFRLVVLLLSIPDADIQVVFTVLDLDDSGSISAQEFEVVLSELEKRAGLSQRYHARPGKVDSIATPAAEKTPAVPGNLGRTLFGKNLDKPMDLKRFRSFLDQLHSDVTRLEFAHYDANGDGKIKGVDFANSIAAAADIRSVDKYLDRVDAMDPALRDAPITFREFSSLAQLRRHLHKVVYALEFCQRVGRPVGKPELSKLVERLIGVRLAPRVVDVLFALAGGGEGRLDVAELARLLRHRDRLPGRKSNHFPTVRKEAGPIVRTWACVKECIVDPDDHAAEPPEE